MREVLEILVPWVISTTLIFAVIIWDERRLSRREDPRLERAWPPAGRSSAIVGFGLVAVPLHFIRTRRSLIGILLAIGWTAGLIVAESGALYALDLALGDDAIAAERDAADAGDL